MSLQARARTTYTMRKASNMWQDQAGSYHARAETSKGAITNWHNKGLYFRAFLDTPTAKSAAPQQLSSEFTRLALQQKCLSPPLATASSYEQPSILVRRLPLSPRAGLAERHRCLLHADDAKEGVSQGFAQRRGSVVRGSC